MRTLVGCGEMRGGMNLIPHGLIGLQTLAIHRNSQAAARVQVIVNDDILLPWSFAMQSSRVLDHATFE